MIDRVPDRSSFAALRRSRRRVRVGDLTVVHLAVPTGGEDPELPRRVAFSVSKRVGKAVIRNKVRRRLRAILTEDLKTAEPLLAPGTYLFIAGPKIAVRSYRELKQNVEDALHHLDSLPSPRRSGDGVVASPPENP